MRPYFAMATAIDPKDIMRLYGALNERVLAKDSKGTLQIYDELLRLGQPLSEIMAQGLRALDDPSVGAPDDADKTFTREADATTLDAPRAPDTTRPEPAPESIAGIVGEPPNGAFASDVFGAAPPIAGETGDKLPATATPHARAGRSPIARLGLAAGAIAVLAGAAVLLMDPAVQVAPGSLIGDALAIVRGETGPLTEPAARAQPTPVAPERDVVPAVVPPAQTVVSAEPRPAPLATSASPTPPAVAEPAPTGPPDQPRPLDPEIAALLARGDSLLKAGAAAAAPAPELTPKQPRLTDLEIAGLRGRGDSLLGVGDIASARLFYERASDAGDGRAALRLGATYDPGFLGQVQLPHLQGDVAQALSWYRRARDLGESEAERWIHALEAKSGR
jgi:hypothetical protein